MKEFLPWSIKVYEQAKNKYINGQFTILDIQLNGKCNFNCVYCDSPNRNLKTKINFDHLEWMVSKSHVSYDWIFVCGLGEPLYGENKQYLIRLLELCEKAGIKCSIFTNGSNIDEHILSFVKSGILYPIIKIDSFDCGLCEILYGTSKAYKNLSAIQELFNVSKKIEDDYYHIAASIVPTTKNIEEIPNIVEKCIEYNVFPLLGQLEYAGNAMANYNDLLLSKNDLLNLKDTISQCIGCEYKVPICPSTIAGIHINNNGYVSVDKKSGLSCSWFWLETPQTEELCDINLSESFYEIEQKIYNYRKKTINHLYAISSEIEECPFGGCGGNIVDLIDDYLKINKDLLEKY